MRKFLLFCLLCVSHAFGQYYPPAAITAQNPSNQQVYVASDGSGNIYTNPTGSVTAAITVSGYIPPVAMTGQSPSGAQVYLKTDSSGNLYVDNSFFQNYQNLSALTVTSNAATLATAGYYYTSATVTLNHTTTTTVTLSGITAPGASVSLYASQDSTGGNTITLAGCPTGNFLVGTGVGLVSSTTPALTAAASGSNNINVSYTGANCMVVVI